MWAYTEHTKNAELNRMSQASVAGCNARCVVRLQNDKAKTESEIVSQRH